MLLASMMQQQYMVSQGYHSLTVEVDGKGATNPETWWHNTARQAATPPLNLSHVSIFTPHNASVTATALIAVLECCVLKCWNSTSMEFIVKLKACTVRRFSLFIPAKQTEPISASCLFAATRHYTTSRRTNEPW